RVVCFPATRLSRASSVDSIKHVAFSTDCTIRVAWRRHVADELKRAVVWKNLLLDGRDYCCLWHTAEGWLLKGTVVGVLKDHRPMQASYEIYCDENWVTVDDQDVVPVSERLMGGW